MLIYWIVNYHQDIDTFNHYFGHLKIIIGDDLIKIFRHISYM